MPIDYKERVFCEACNCHITVLNMYRHKKSPKHRDNVQKTEAVQEMYKKKAAFELANGLQRDAIIAKLKIQNLTKEQLQFCINNKDYFMRSFMNDIDYHIRH